MPGTTRYSATFDRTYEEDDRVGSQPPTNQRRSRSHSLQTLSGLDGRPYTPLGARPPSQRSSSTDSGAKGPDHIPTRTVGKTAVKAHNNPFQFVKVGTCPLYKKAEELLQKTKEVKKQDVFREEEEEWQTNLDSWKSRRRKMSEDVFRRQEEIKQFEIEEQTAQASQKKIKTFSEMVESRAHRGRTLSLCLLTSPLEFQDWEFENKGNKNGSCSTFTDESEENSTVNSEDEGVSLRGRLGRPIHHDNENNHRTNGDSPSEQNGSKLETHNGDLNNVRMKPKEGSYIDSGLESISSSHRAGDTPDSCSDFSQDSNSSIDCESPRTGVNILEEFSSKSLQMSPSQELSVKLSLTDKTEEFGFQFQGGKDAGQVLISSVSKGSKAESSGIHVGDQIIAVEGTDISSKKDTEIISIVQKGQEKGEISLLLWRHSKTTNGFNSEDKHVESLVKPNKTDSQNAKSESQQYEKSIESENEMYVDDFEELQRQSELLTSMKKSETICTNSQALSNGNTSTILSSDKDSIKTYAPKLKEPCSNGAVDRQNKNEKTNSEISTENPKKNIIKVKRVRRKGVYALDVSATPNQIPQEGIPVNSLFPLSPVTELPSPADEYKTMASTLSPKPTTPVSNSVNGILSKEAGKVTEVKLNSPTIKENNKITPSVQKSVSSKTGPSDKGEIETDCTSVPSSPTVTKNKVNISVESLVEEKPKIPSSPKKVKVKVKKANTSSEQKSSESSQVAKETPTTAVTQLSDFPVKKLDTESQPKKVQKFDSLTDGKPLKVNKNENVEPSQKRENNIPSIETAVVKSDATCTSSKDKTSAINGETSSKAARNLSLKIDGLNESVNLPTTPPVTNTKQLKTPVDDKSKPPFAPKKEKIKPKENNAGSAPVTPEEKPLSSKGKTITTTASTNASSNVKNLALKIEKQNESVHLAAVPPVSNNKQPQTPQNEKASSSLAQKKEKTKLKENGNLPVETAVGIQVKSTESNDKSPATSTNESKSVLLNTDVQSMSINLAATPSIPKANVPKSPFEEKSKPLTEKREKSESKEENSDLTAETAATVQDTKSTISKDKTHDTNKANSSVKNGNLSLNIQAQDHSVNSATQPPVSNAKQPKTPKDDKTKSFAQKKDEAESKVKPPEQMIPADSSQEPKETFTITISTCSSPSVSLSTESQIPDFDEMKRKALNEKEKIESSETMENDSKTSGFAIVIQETKSMHSRDKTSPVSSATSFDDTRNLLLNSDAQNQLITTPSVVHTKLPKTPQEEKSKPSFAQKKEKSKSKENNILSSGTPVIITESKTIDSKEKSASSDKTSTSLNVDAQEESITLVLTPPVMDSKQPKTPQEEKTKPRLTRKRSKGKAAKPMSLDPSLVDKESSSMSVSCSSAADTLSEIKLHKEYNCGSQVNDVPVNMLTENTESSKTREKNVLSSGTPAIIPESKSVNSKEKSASSAKTKRLSLKIETQKESVTLDKTSPVGSGKPPKTPQDEKTKPSLVRKRSKSKGKATKPMSPSLVDKESPDISMSCPSASETSSIGLEHCKELSFVSLADNVSVNVFNESTESSETRDNNISSYGTPAIVPESNSASSKEKSAISSDKTRNLSLKIDSQKESVTSDTTSPVGSSKSPKTPQDEKTKPRLIRKRSKSKGKATESISPGPSLVDKESSNLSVSCSSAAETLSLESEHLKDQNLASVANDVQENKILSSGTPAIAPESKSASSKGKSPLSSDKTRNLSLKIDIQKESVTSDTASSVGNSKSPKTPQGEKAKPRLARKRSKSKGKAIPQASSDPSVVDKESSNSSVSHTSVAETSSSESKPHKEQNSANVANGVPSNLMSESTESAKKREDNVLLSGTRTITPESKSTSSNRKFSLSDKNDSLSVKTEASKQSVALDTPSTVENVKEPKTPVDEKAKPRLTRKRSKSKVKNTEQLSIASQMERESPKDSVCHTSAAKTFTSENELCKDKKSGTVVHDTTVKMPHESTELSESMENNDLSPATPTALPEAKSESLKEENMLSNIAPSDKSKNLSLNINAQNESVTSAMTPEVVNSKQPKTPQNEKAKPCLSRKKEASKSKDNSASSAETATVIPGVKSTASSDKISVSNTAADSVKARNLTLKIDASNQSMSTTVISPAVNDKQPKTPADEKSKPSFAQKKDSTKPKEKANLSLATSAVCANIEKNESQKSPSTTVTSCNVINPISSQTSLEKNECLISSEASSAKNDLTQSSVSPQEDKSEPLTPKKTKRGTKKKNANSQKVNSPAKQNEELMNLNIDSLNVIFQSEPKNTLTENQSFNVKNCENNSNKKAATDLVPDIPPVEKVAEEMEKLILEQLEEEERAKELASETKSAVGSPEHLLIAPPRLAEPPKEKPPPPPSASEGSQKDSSLKRVNSTKRIKKEIHKRRSNFLGIENADENIVCNEPSIPPPPALEEILKAEMELDRQSRIKIENAATERLTMEEKEIMQKEREIIESLESEERQKQLINGTGDFKNVMPITPSDAVFEDDHILSFQSERRRLETECLVTEEQQLHILEEKQLREREEFIRKQEASKSAGPHSDSSLSVAANAPNNSKPALSSLTETKSKVSLSDTNGDGKNVTSNSSSGVSENKSSECDGKDKASEKPAVPPKPLKKKEAIRKERERLRQEQEALQREREEHRRKLMLEQEELMKHQKSHAPDAPVTQLGPLPPLVPPNFPPQLTTTMNATPNARESASFPSRSHHGAPNGAAGSINAVELMGPPVVRQNRTPASRKAVQNEAWGQQKMPSVRKQNHDSLTESRYNQNHWLIQEAEMRRITEFKERQQRASQLPCSQTHLAEDDVCSNPPRVPVITPTHNQHLNYAVQDKMWNYGQSNKTPKKYPPPVVKDPLHSVYPREAVSQQPPTKPSRVVPMERQEQMLSVSGRKRCSHCNEELGRGAAMIIESLQLYYHIHCFQCCVCQAQLGNGSCGTDVRVRNNKLHCHNCYSNDEAGLKFSQV